jgi:hypothetical protein
MRLNLEAKLNVSVRFLDRSAAACTIGDGDEDTFGRRP